MKSATFAAPLCAALGDAAGQGDAAPSPKVRTVACLLFDDVELLDFAGPYEVFWEARPVGRSDDESALFRPITIAEKTGAIRCRGGLPVSAQYALDNHPAIDLLVVPGGQGTRRERLNARLLDWIAAQDKRTELTTSVCTGAFLLAERGLLDGRKATTHWASVDWMRKQYPRVKMTDNERFVDEGHVITSAGISAGIDMALHVVARLHGNDVAAWTARRIQYDYWPRA